MKQVEAHTELQVAWLSTHYQGNARTVTFQSSDSKYNIDTKDIKDTCRLILEDSRSRDLSFSYVAKVRNVKDMTIDQQTRLLMCISPRDWSFDRTANLGGGLHRLPVAVARIENSSRNLILGGNAIGDRIIKDEAMLFRRPYRKSKPRKCNELPFSPIKQVKQETECDSNAGMDFLDTTCSNITNNKAIQYKQQIGTNMNTVLRFSQKPALRNNEGGQELELSVIWNAIDPLNGQIKQADLVETSLSWKKQDGSIQTVCNGCDTWLTDIQMQQDQLYETMGPGSRLSEDRQGRLNTCKC
jgi:hypothetical protein